MNPEYTYALLERLANLLRAEERRAGRELGLQPVHLHALSYLSRANRYSDTPAAVAEYLGLTKGTASQTLMVLSDRKLLESTPDVADRRKVHLNLTKSGRRVVSQLTPPGIFEDALRGLSEELTAPLEELLRALQRAGDYRTFGVCKTCRFFESKASQFRCGLTGERLKLVETTRICREHSVP